MEWIPWVIISTEASSGTRRIGDNFIKCDKVLFGQYSRTYKGFQNIVA